MFCVFVFYWLIKRYEKKWWLYVWLLIVLFLLFLFFIQLVIIDFLYNDFYLLKNKEFESKILELVEEVDILVDYVYEVNMFEKINVFNVYVIGIGVNKWIVLWDMMFNKFDDLEIFFIMGYEMGYYVMKYVYIGLVGYLLVLFVGFYVIDKFYKLMVCFICSMFYLEGWYDFVVLLLLLFLVFVLSFVVMFFFNVVLWYQENQVDWYGIELMENREVVVKMFQDLVVMGLSQVDFFVFVKIFRGSYFLIMEWI